MKFVKNTLIAITIICVLSLVITRKSKSKKARGDDVHVVRRYNDYTSNNENGDVVKLKAQNVICPAGSALSQFRLQTQEKKKLKYNYICTKNTSIEGNPRVAHTAYNSKNGDGGATNFLDRHQMKCNSNEVIQRFQLQESNSKIRYEYTCVKAHTESCYNKETGWTKGGKGYKNIYLDRQDVKVPLDTNQAIQSIKLEAKYRSWSLFYSYNVEYRYHVRICSLVPKEPEPVADPVQEKKIKEIMKLDEDERDNTEHTKKRRRFR